MPEATRVDVTGTISELLPRALYRVAIDDRHDVLAHASDDIRKNFIRLLVGDRVRVRLSPHDLTRGRITHREA
jgi:translation initiation factor IF-1